MTEHLNTPHRHTLSDCSVIGGVNFDDLNRGVCQFSLIHTCHFPLHKWLIDFGTEFETIDTLISIPTNIHPKFLASTTDPCLNQLLVKMTTKWGFVENFIIVSMLMSWHFIIKIIPIFQISSACSWPTEQTPNESNKNNVGLQGHTDVIFHLMQVIT